VKGLLLKEKSRQREPSGFLNALKLWFHRESWIFRCYARRQVAEERNVYRHTWAPQDNAGNEAEREKDMIISLRTRIFRISVHYILYIVYDYVLISICW